MINLRAFLYNVQKNWSLPVLWLSAWLIDIFTELFSSFLETWVPLTINTFIFLLGLPIVLYAAVKLAKHKNDWILVPREKQPPVHQGLIILVGKGTKEKNPLDTAVGPAIDYHLKNGGENHLKVVWLLPSQDAIHAAEAFRAKYESEIDVHIRDIGNAFALQPTYEAVNEIYENEIQNYQLQPMDVISDFTGGTRLMTAGMVLACQDRYHMQYMSGKNDTSSKPIYIDFQPREIN